MNNFGQYYGESLMDAWYRIKGMSKNGVNKHTLATLIRNFYNGLDGWSKCFLDSLTNGRFVSSNPSRANNLMENLFGNSIETKYEIGIKQLKVSMDRSILGLQTYVEEYPTKNEMHSFILHAKSRMKKTKNTLSEISWKIETIFTHAKSKKELTMKLKERISSMLEPLDRDIKNCVEEEDKFQTVFNAALKEKIENIYMRTKRVEEVKMLSEVKEPLLDLDNCSLHELISILQKVASDPSINANQAGFGSYIANHVLKEKIARYNQEAMIPPKLGDYGFPKY